MMALRKTEKVTGASNWMLPIMLTLILTLQIGVKADDVMAQRIDTVDGQTLYAWSDDIQGASHRVSEDEVDIEQHIPMSHEPHSKR
ncbi:hypothetical protein JCM19237_6062 [Photobacterium aphoticum]|uniref:Uncharacterized protein n=1 Tax=Photobacterium aphoticum TaxID=754436 RepID=A0A090QMX4_9GAMM|nr:hypothetical protein JCM19237_6062 [Photobacterium aphoticum]